MTLEELKAARLDGEWIYFKDLADEIMALVDAATAIRESPEFEIPTSLLFELVRTVDSFNAKLETL